MSILLPFDARLSARTLVVGSPLTDEQVEELCRANEDVRIERTKEGIIRMKPPAGGLTGDGNAEIGWRFRSWWKRHRNGRAFDSNTGFYLPDRPKHLSE
jgi:Uma2 family endonuclease